MACSNHGQEDEAEALDRSMDRNGSAAIGCFLKCENDSKKLYAMVCKHVTNFAQATFFVEIQHSTIPIAKKIATEENPDTTYLNDVDIIEMLNTSRIQIKTNYLNESGKKCDFRLYQGKFEDLFGETVFHCYRPNGEKDNKIETKTGRVKPMSSAIGIPSDASSAKSHFVVKGTDGTSFAKPGDSGRIVAREVNGIIELVGIITWNEFNCKGSQETSEDDSVCMFLPSAIEYLNKEYGMQLILHKTEEDTGTGKEIIEPGQILKFTLAQNNKKKKK